jgi:RNA polymerase sigma-70 factor (ECF subfamily)
MPACVDDILLTRIKAGDPASLEELYARTRDRLFNVLRRLGADAATAEDLVHEVFLRFWMRRDRLPAMDSPLAYLCASARNLWSNLCEQRGVMRRLMDRLARLRRVARPGNAPIEAEELNRALATLDEGPRETFVLHRFGGLSYREIAAVQGVSIKTVEARMKRAFDDLRLRLRERMDP